MAAFRNVFACLVHEQFDCVADLVRNLHSLDPDSLVMLYNGGTVRDLLAPWRFPFERHNAFVHPTPRAMSMGRLHPFAIDCMRLAIELGPFDALTIVDSDQLALRPGYSRALAEHLASRRSVGLLGSAQPSPNGRQPPAVRAALGERALWQPFLREFSDGESKFGMVSFWPSTLFTADACRAIVDLWDRSDSLREIMQKSRIWATEEVVLPTLTGLLGFDVQPNPFRAGYVQNRAEYSVAQLERALGNPFAYWMHPVPRRYDHPLRQHIRAQFGEYRACCERVA